MKYLPFRIVVNILFSLGFVNTQAQNRCDLLYTNNFVFGDFDDTLDDKYGGSIVTFFPEFLIEKRRKRSGQGDTYAVISNAQGRLLFYTNGCDVFDRRDSIVENGSGINPGSIHDFTCPNNYGFSGLQNIFFLPSSYDTSIYYLVYIGEIFNPDHSASNLILCDKIYISTLSSEMGEGYGGILDKNQVILEDTGMLGQPIDAVRHANGLDWWIITPDRWTNKWHVVRLGQSGASYIGPQIIGDLHDTRSSGGQGRFSPDGSIFAWYQPRNGLFLYDFDRSNGTLSNFRKVEVTPIMDRNTGGLEFSPTGRFLYVNFYYSLYQLDMEADDLAGSIVHIADYDGFADPPPLYTTFLYMTRTPDKRIFLNPQSGSRWLHVIQEPEKKGTACRFEQHVIQLPTINNFALPFFPTYSLGALGEELCDTMTVSVLDANSSPMPQVSIAPNPVKDVISVSTAIPPSHICIFNPSGQIVRSVTDATHSTNFTIDVENLNAGIYFLQLDFELALPVTKKFAVAR